MKRFNAFVCTLAITLSSATAFAEGGLGDWQGLPPKRPVETTTVESRDITSATNEQVKFSSPEEEQEARAVSNDSWLDSAITELSRLVSF